MLLFFHLKLVNTFGNISKLDAGFSFCNARLVKLDKSVSFPFFFLSLFFFFLTQQYVTVTEVKVRECGGVLESTIGVILPLDVNEDGLYDYAVDCMWLIHVPNDHVVRYSIVYIYIQDSQQCSKDRLLVS